MEGQTPTFCTDFLEGRSFSDQCEIFSKFKPKKRFSLFGVKTLENNKTVENINNNEKKRKYNKHKSNHKHKRRHHSEFGKIKKSIFNQDIKKIIKKNKFKIRNDFDDRNAKKFLLSKEKAFEVPFLLINDNE